MFLFYGLFFEFYSLTVWYIYYSMKRLYIHHDLLLQQHIYTRLLLFYDHYCLQRMSISLFQSNKYLNPNTSGLFFHVSKD